KQKVKYLLYEQQNRLSELKAEGVVSTKLQQEEHDDPERQLHMNLRSLKVDLKEQELSSEKELKNLQLKHDQQITDLRNDFARQVQKIGSKYEKKMQKLRQEEELRWETKEHEIKERNISHINMLMKDHERAIKDMRSFFKGVVHKDLEYVTSLEEELKNMTMVDHDRSEEMTELLQQNKEHIQFSQKAKEEVAALQKQLADYEKDKSALARARARLKVLDKEMKDLKLDHELVLKTLTTVQSERDELYTKFTRSILEVQQKSGFKNLLLKRKLSTLHNTLEKKETQLSEVLAASNLDPTAGHFLPQISQKKMYHY
ncbi:MAG: hypothetical protein ACRDDA_11640, partial [Aeromonas sp.]